MSHIPNSAIPHAGPAIEPEEEASPSLKQRAGKLADVARENPKTAVATGAALLAGAIAAAAIPLVRSRSKTTPKKPASGGSKSGSRKKTAG